MRLVQLLTTTLFLALLGTIAQAGYMYPNHSTSLKLLSRPVYPPVSKEVYPPVSKEEYEENLKISQAHWAIVKANMPEKLLKIIPSNIPADPKYAAYRDWYYGATNDWFVFKTSGMDFFALQPGVMNYDGSIAPYTIIPEPSTIILLIMGILVSGVFLVRKSS
ncbi:MAG: PEP-CTERM sorting domain-containing protein [Pirellulales bacterium]|nr:PEP-CTERM sorting domain-containing protein [Pirellulales bacterium]